jgi:hypothetical protein
MRKRNKSYFNAKQLAFFRAPQKIRTLLWGRGTGKSTAIAGINRLKMGHLARAKVFFSSTTYSQILTKTLPPIEAKWQEFGFVEDLHYVVGRKPPKGFAKPYSPPKKYENVITFFNGYTIEFLSLDRPDLARGGSYDGGEIDEAALVKQEHFTKVLLASVRGNRHRFNHHLHQNVNLYTSQPWKPSGYWILEYEEKARAFPHDYYFSRANYKDNIAILGEDWVETMRREMGYLTFLMEVENEQLTKVEGGFYHWLDEEKHCYTPSYAYHLGQRGILVSGPKDCRPEELLELSFDFGGWFNCVTIYQEDLRAGVERMIDSLHVEGDEKVNDLVDQFTERYQHHQFKYVRVYGEPRGHDRRSTGDTIYTSIRKRLVKAGWEVDVRVQPGRTNNHLERYNFMETIGEEATPTLPKLRINQDNCKDVIIAMQLTEINEKFQKVKKAERDRNYPQQHAPHYTDTVDYYLVQKHAWKLYNPEEGRAGTVDFL